MARGTPFFVGEVSFRSDDRRGTTWGKIGETPIVRDSGRRFGFKLISAVSAHGDLHFDVIDSAMNAAPLIAFLQKIRYDADCPVFIIADNVKYHHSKRVSTFLEAQSGQIMMAFLSPYSPDLSPDEQLWNHDKAEAGKRIIRSKQEIEVDILATTQSIQLKIEMLRSFFRLTATLYAKDLCMRCAVTFETINTWQEDRCQNLLIVK